MGSIRVLFALGAGERGGAERALVALVRHLAQHGVEPAVAAMSTGPFVEELRHSGAEVLELPVVPRLRKAWAVPSAVGQLAGAARTSGAEVIVGSGEKMALLSVAASRRCGTRSLAWLHDAPGHTATARVLQKALRFARPDIVVASSRWMAAEFERRLDREVACVPYGLELAELLDARPATDAVEGWAGRTVFAFVGRLQRWKGVDVYLRAAAALCAHRDDVGFLVVGGSLFGRDQRYASSLPRLARILGIDEQVRFLGHRHDSVQVMAAADVIVHASRRPEPLGIVILEAMALGKPVIASRTLGPEELIDHGRTGLLVAPGDHVQLAESMERAARMSREERDRIGRAAAAAFSSEWSAPAMAAAFAKALGA